VKRYPDRALLHIDQLQMFRDWLDSIGVKWRDTAAAYQVLQVYSQRTGDWVPIYKRNEATEHLTVQGRMVPLVRRFIRERKS
jgi:hypothetical protein